jgi:predicted ribosome quality control (RQC) complex YloA/Tae2 family protein
MIRTAEFISRLAMALGQNLPGSELAVCFSQNRDELMLGFALPAEDFWIQADLEPEVSMLYFPKEFYRAKKNSVDLFPELIGLKVKEVVAHVNERSFHVVFEQGFDLMFKMHGKNGNLLLFKDKKLLEIFRHNLENDWKIDLNQFTFSTEKGDEKGALEEANQQFEEFKRTFYIAKERENLAKSLKAKIDRTQNYLEKTRKKLEEVKQKSDYEKIGHIIMANLHLKIMNQPLATFFDFYENKEIEVKLKPDQTLQKNAENYYRKSKNQKLETDNVAKNLASKETLILELKKHLAYVEQEQDLKLLRNYVKQYKLVSTPASEQKPEFPFLTFEAENFVIWVGKNSQNNDLLTLKYAHKEDLWLHAKDVPGSHVIIKYQSGKTFPKTVIEKAAQLAAFYSKRKNDTLAPVTVTPRKYVRKPKGLAPGQVMVDREDVVLVQPKLI